MAIITLLITISAVSVFKGTFTERELSAKFHSIEHFLSLFLSFLYMATEFIYMFTSKRQLFKVPFIYKASSSSFLLSRFL